MSYSFQQDATPAHRAKLAREWCRRQLPDFIGEEEWSSYFPELDSLESHEWSLIRREPVEFAVPVLSPRMQKLEDGWEEMEKDTCVPHAIKSKANFDFYSPSSFKYIAINRCK